MAEQSSRFSHIVLGGTFDHFHLGHQKLLEKAFQIGNKLTIGIAQKNLCNNKLLSQTIESYSARKNSVEKCLQDYLVDDRLIDIISISDIYGMTLTDKSIDAIVVSKATVKNAQKINRLRQKKGWPKIEIIVVDDVFGEDRRLITSARIRLGEIDQKWRSYQLPIIGYRKKQLVLPEYLREELRKPLGKIFKGGEDELEKTAKKILYYFKSLKSPLVISVGDIVTVSLLTVGFDPHLKIVDFKARRKDIRAKYNDEQEMFARYNLRAAASKLYPNQPGTINRGSTERLRELIKKALYKKEKSWLVVDGEEDLLALPAILFAPLESLVLYGQMDLGVVAVTVTEEKKKEAKAILRRFV